MEIETLPNFVAPQIHIFQSDWAFEVSRVIRSAIDRVITEKKVCTVMLTGGNTAQKIYQCWSDLRDFPHESIIYYFGDERCVPLDHPDSNYGSGCQALFPRGIPQNTQIHPMRVDFADPVVASSSYEYMLPYSVDVLLLGLGDDGHVASIFPGDPVATEFDKLVVPVIGPKSPSNRLTITPKVIIRARKVFLLAVGAEKGKILSKVLHKTGSVRELPVRWASNAVWMLDGAAAQEL